MLPNEQINLHSWIHVKGEGKLVEPSSQLIEMVAKCDGLFNSYHGKGLRLGKNHLEKLNSRIFEIHPDLPPKLISLLCKVKFFSRIKDLNKQIKLSSGKKSVRSLKQLGQFTN